MLLIALTLAVTDPAPAPPIIVTAPRLTDAEIATRASSYVSTVLPTPLLGQYGRWNGKVCVQVAGIEDAPAEQVAARIRSTATTAGIELAPAGCRPNLTIVFSADARATVATIVRKKPRALIKLDTATRAAIRTAPLPVRWWYGTEFSSRDGMPATPLGAALMSAPGGGGKPLYQILPAGPDAVMTDGYSSSIIHTNLKVSIDAAMAIVDVPLATGKTLDAVADYVALVTLAPMRLPPPAPGVPSILTLFDPGSDAPAGLSSWDRAYLAGLYAIPAARQARQQRAMLAGAIADAIRE